MFDFVLNNIDDNNNMRVNLFNSLCEYIYILKCYRNRDCNNDCNHDYISNFDCNNYCNHDYINIRTCNHTSL